MRKNARPPLAAAVRAGRSAAETGDPAAAYRYLRDAVAVWDRVPAAARPAGTDRADLLAEAGMAAHRLGQSEPAVALLRDAVRTVDAAHEPARAALLYERLGRVDSGPGAWQAIHSGLALVPDGPRDVRAALVAGLARVAVRWSRFADARRYAAAALALAPDGPTAVTARRALGTALVAEGRTDDGLRELPTAAEATGEGRRELSAALIRSGLPADATGSDDPCPAAAAYAATGQWELARARLEETASGGGPGFTWLVAA